MTTNRTIIVALVLLLLGSTAPVIMTASASGHCDIDVPADHSTIQAALNAAAAGDTVCVGAGVFVGALNIPNRADLTLVGAGMGETIIDAGQQSSRGIGAEFSPSATNSGLRLEGFTITNSTHYGIKLAYAEDARIIDVHVVDNGRTGIDLNTVSSVVLDNVRSVSNGGNGIAIRNADDVQVQNAFVAGNAWGGLAFYAPGTETVNDVRVTDSMFHGQVKGVYFQYDGYSDILIGGNTFAGHDYGVAVEAHPTFGTPDATGITIRGNSFTANAVGVGNSGSGTLDAVGNYWGNPTGPALLGNPVEGDVDYTLWCVLSGCTL